MATKQFPHLMPFEILDGQVLSRKYEEGNRSATDEETVLWDRIRLLEDLLEAQRPHHVKALLSRIEQSTQDVVLSALEFQLLRAHARERFEIEASPSLIRQGILGSMVRYSDDGTPKLLYLRVTSGQDWT